MFDSEKVEILEALENDKLTRTVNVDEKYNLTSIL